jgi:hypothetical protein
LLLLLASGGEGREGEGEEREQGIEKLKLMNE